MESDEARISASDAGAILGENPRKSAWDVLAARRGTGDPDGPLVVRTPSPPRDRPARTSSAQPKSLRRGNANEPLILRELAAELGGRIDQPSTLRCSGGLRWLVSRPDGILVRTGLPNAAIEVKCHGAPPEGPGVPRIYRAQAQIELLATGLRRLYFAQSWTGPGKELIDEADPPLLITVVRPDPTFEEDIRVLGLFREALKEARRIERDARRGGELLERDWRAFCDAARTLFRRRYPEGEPNLGIGPVAPLAVGEGGSPTPREYIASLGGRVPSKGERPEWDAAMDYPKGGGAGRRAAWLALLGEAARIHPEDRAAAADHAGRASGSQLPSSERRRSFLVAIGWPAHGHAR